MNRDIGDILDRYSIAKLKFERIKRAENRKEFKAFELGFIKSVNKYPKICVKEFAKLLYDINAMIWDLEFDLRKGKLDGALTEVGIRAIKIREHNRLRVEVKNIINLLTREGFQDVKQDHVSE